MSPLQGRAGGSSLRRKLLRLVLSATLAALMLSAVALLLHDILSYRVDRAADLGSQADLLAESLAPTLAFDDARAATAALATLQLRPAVRGAALYRPDGRLFARWLADGEPDIRLPSTAQAGALVDGNLFEHAQTVRQGQETLGTLVLRARYDVLSRLASSLLIVFLASATGLGVALLIFRRVEPTVTGPIIAVAQTSRRIASERDYALRVDAQSDDEVGDLVRAFNAMLSDLSRVMQERASAEAALREADRRKDEFLATLAHELRNPLAPLRNALSLLERVDDDLAVRRQTQAMMVRQLNQLVRLIDDLLDVSRISRGKVTLRIETVELTGLLREALEAAQVLMQQRGHQVEARLPEEPVWVAADPARLTQVFANLLNNAARYTDTGGRICLEAEHSAGGRVAITVRDNGIGIDPSQQHAVFEMFVQVDKALERGGGGLGLGLTIARQLVQLHGGALSVQSAGIGQGAAFIVELITASAPLSRSVIPPPTNAAAGAAVRVLLADDNVDFVNSFAELLRLQGHNVTVAYDGSAALRLASDVRPDVAFLDIGMPTINGYELAPELRHLLGDKVVLAAVTGWGNEEDQRRVKAAGFDRHFVKPIDFDLALQLVTAAGERNGA